MGTVILGLDVGRARIGVARAELGRSLAFGRGWIDRRGTEADIAAVRELAIREDATLIVVGLPSATRGGDTRQTELVRAFATELERAGLCVALEDERFTTALAERRLAGTAPRSSRRRPKGAVDEASAVLILESYLQHASAAVGADENRER